LALTASSNEASLSIPHGCPAPPSRLESGVTDNTTSKHEENVSRLNLKKFEISYVIVRYAGAFMKKNPHWSSETCKRFKKNAVVVIDAILRNEDGEHWFGNSTGWIPGATEGGQNIILPGSIYSPISASIVGTSFVEAKGKKKWTTLLSKVEIIFELEFQFPGGGTNRIFRSYSTILELHERIQADRKDRSLALLTALPYDLQFDVIADMDELMQFENEIGLWASTVVCNSTNMSLTTNFMSPTENDIDLMEAELEANTSRQAYAKDGSALNFRVALTVIKAKNAFKRTIVKSDELHL
jgi:hypothetical protein